MPAKKKDSLTISYLTIRKTLGILGIGLPVILIIGGLFANRMLEITISSYYYTNMRDIFIGVVCGMSIFLISYKGYAFIDDIIATIGGIFAFGIVLFPASTDKVLQAGTFLLSENISGIIHSVFSALFFLTLAAISFFLFTKSDGTPITEQKIWRNRIYRTCAVIIVVSLVLDCVCELFLKNTPVAAFKPILILESISLWAFGVSWLIKGETLLTDQ